MGKKKKKEDEAPAGAPEWIVTFSDMISLLVTFFVMLMSFSTMEEREEMVISAAFANAGTGVVMNLKGHSAVEPPENDRMSASHPLRGALEPHSRPDEELLDNLEEMGQKKTDDRLELDFSKAVDGLQIHFGREATFAPGSSAVPPELEKRLVELGGVLEHYSHLVVVEGFTDSHFQPTPRHATAESLSAARARAAAETMLRTSRLSPDMIQVAGLGDTRPRSPNETASDRTDNRRVEVRILSLTKTRAQSIEAARREDADG
jgi:chemotaxis protein MotB